MFSTLRSLSASTHIVISRGLKHENTLLQRYILTRPATRLFTSSTPINAADGSRRSQPPRNDESFDPEVLRELSQPRYDDLSPRSRASTRPSSSTQGNEPAITNEVGLSNLPFDVTEWDLKVFFASCGPLLSVDIWADANGRTTGRGSVTFVEIAGAQAALALDYGLLLGRRVRVVAVRPQLPSATLLVTNVGRSTQEDLWELFSDPQPLRIRIPAPRDGMPRGFAHVQYRTVQESQYALKKYNHAMLGSSRRPLEIFFAKESERDKLETKKNTVPARSPSETLFVGNLDYEATESDVEDMFAEFHPVAVYISRGASGNPLGSGQVKFRSVLDAQNAMEASAGKKLFGRPLRVDFATRPALNPPCDTLFVGNVEFNVTNEELEEVFAEFNPVAFSRRSDPEGRPHPYAHVRFRSTEHAQQAMEACNNKELLGRPLAVLFASEGSGSDQRSPDNADTKYQVRVVNIPSSASIQNITDFFSACGTVAAVRKGINGIGQFSGRVYVTFADSLGEQAALRLDGSFFQDECIRVSPLSSAVPTRTLHIKNLPNSVTKKDLLDVFTFPEPLEVRVSSGQLRGFAHVVYRTAKEAQEARDRNNLHMLAGKAMEIFFVDDNAKS